MERHFCMKISGQEAVFEKLLGPKLHVCLFTNR